MKKLNISILIKLGCPEIGHDTLEWVLKIKNNGDLPATDIEVMYSLVIDKAEIEFGVDAADIISHRFQEYTRITKTIKYDYLPPNGETHDIIIYLQGEFSSAKLKVDYLLSKERNFIDKEITLINYKHPMFDIISDSEDYRKLLGANKQKG